MNNSLVVDDYSYIYIYGENFWSVIIKQIRKLSELETELNLKTKNSNNKKPKNNEGGCCKNGCAIF